MTKTSNTTDPRVEAAAAALWEHRPMMRTADGSPRPWDEVPAWSYGARYRSQAQVALAAADAVDPRKSRTITTAEERDSLPAGTVLRSDAGTIACRFDERFGVIFGDERPFEWARLRLPAVVLDEADSEAAA